MIWCPLQCAFLYLSHDTRTHPHGLVLTLLVQIIHSALYCKEMLKFNSLTVPWTLVVDSFGKFWANNYVIAIHDMALVGKITVTFVVHTGHSWCTYSNWTEGVSKFGHLVLIFMAIRSSYRVRRAALAPPLKFLKGNFYPIHENFQQLEVHFKLKIKSKITRIYF